MSALILDGKSLANKTEAELSERVSALKQANNGQAPILATVLVGSDPASGTYVKMKQNACKRIGMESIACLLYTSPSPRDKRQSRMPSSA